MAEKREKKESKEMLHPRNRHRGSYDFDALIGAYAALERFVAPNKFGTRSINFFDPAAVKALNAALLALHYKIEWWDIPSSALTPPIPGRADYIHYAADLLSLKAGSAVRCLDIGTGANCIYPIIGRAEYGWEFVGSDIDDRSIESAQQIIDRNSLLKGHVELRKQHCKEDIFKGVIGEDDYFDLTICNPPFHDSAQSAKRGSERKLRGLKAKNKGILNFAGQSNELWCEGGERLFIERMISQSVDFKRQCEWFTTLVSSEDNLPPLRSALRKVGAQETRTIEMHQGNKRSRILAWRF
ncbi:MAG: 23S rRNA (adenine(1618)-N(6))-methyltransferase RlmF [Rikenellaceae bacterium]